MVSINNLSASYGKTKVLDHFCLNLTRGESYALIGPSGCGKSTLLKILCGIHKEFSGEITYLNQPFFSQKITIGYVPQNYGLLDWKKVKDNILLPLKLNKSKDYNQNEASEILDTLGIADLMDRYPLQLSGGQRQRVALARAFIYKPDLLLMDEPFSSLDSFTSANSQKLFLKLWKKYNITTLFITHNIFEATTTCKQIVLMDKKSGNVINQIENNSLFEKDNTQKIQLASRIFNLFEENITK